MKRNYHNQKGYTLVELMIAMGLSAFVLSMVMGIYRVCAKFRNQGVTQAILENKAFKLSSILNYKLMHTARIIKLDRNGLLLKDYQDRLIQIKQSNGQILINEKPLGLGNVKLDYFEFSIQGNDLNLDNNLDGKVDQNELDRNGDQKLSQKELESVSMISYKMNLKLKNKTLKFENSVALRYML